LSVGFFLRCSNQCARVLVCFFSMIPFTLLPFEVISHSVIFNEFAEIFLGGLHLITNPFAVRYDLDLAARDLH